MTFSERFEKILIHLDLNKSVFSKEIGLNNNTTVSRIIKGDTKPSTNTLKLVIKRFPQIDYDWLLTGQGKMLVDNKNTKTKKNEDTTYKPTFFKENGNSASVDEISVHITKNIETFKASSVFKNILEIEALKIILKAKEGDNINLEKL